MGSIVSVSDLTTLKLSETGAEVSRNNRAADETVMSFQMRLRKISCHSL